MKQVPEVSELIAATNPRLQALQVPAAKVRLKGSIAGNLMFIAQEPRRFTGQIHVAGKELISVAFHEQRYTLRNVSDRGSLPVGFYAGPDAACAIEPLIGLRFRPRDFVQVVLGGIPDIPAVDSEFVEVLDQHWDGSQGHEVLRLRKENYERELRFTWMNEAWWPAGATQWRVERPGQRTWLWTLEHDGHHKVASTVLPGRTRITRPTPGGTQTVVITYRKQVPNPSLPSATSADAPDGQGDGWDDGWDSDEGWEDEEEPASAGGDVDATPPSADDGGASATGVAPASPGSGDATAGEPGPSKGPRVEAPPKRPAGAPNPAPAPAVPEIFELKGDDLPHRGDLCRRARG